MPSISLRNTTVNRWNINLNVFLKKTHKTELVNFTGPTVFSLKNHISIILQGPSSESHHSWSLLLDSSHYHHSLFWVLRALTICLKNSVTSLYKFVTDNKLFQMVLNQFHVCKLSNPNNTLRTLRIQKKKRTLRIQLC